jgi:YjbE family integral membrane protein
MDVASTAFWAALGSIILTDIILSGDNAVVIALAARSLPPHQRSKAIVFGSGAAIVLRVVLTLVAAKLLQLPYLKLVGGALLLYIGIQLLIEEEDEAGGEHDAAPKGLMSAVRTILIADLVMSLDNVLAVAAAAHGDTVLLVIGLGLSIPLIVFGSTLLLGVMQRFPIIITLGGALLGYLAGEMFASDPGLVDRIGPLPEFANRAAGAVGAALVVGTGLLVQRRRAIRSAGA